MTATIAHIGHNKGPELTIEERLQSDHEEIISKLEAARALANALPKTVQSEKDVADFVEIVASAKRANRALEDARVREKEPHLKAGRSIDAFFKNLTDIAGRISTTLEGRINDFQREKARKEREAREAEAARQREIERIAREEAERKLREAEEAERANAPTVDQVERLTDAVEADQVATVASMKADIAEHRAGASVTDLGRVRTAAGTASVRSVWAFEVEDISKVPLDVIRNCIPRADIEKAIGAYVRLGGRELPGVRIYEDFKTTVR